MLNETPGFHCSELCNIDGGNPRNVTALR